MQENDKKKAGEQESVTQTTEDSAAQHHRRTTGGDEQAGVAPAKDWVIVTRGLKREYDMGGEIVRALRGVDIAIRRNEYVAIMGPSGSGKSTLMNLIGCLDTPDAGEYWLSGESRVGEGRRRARARAQPRDRIRLPDVQPSAAREALHNVELPLVYAGVPADERTASARLQRSSACSSAIASRTGRTSSPAVSGSVSQSRARS